jgi:hypothetical protein
MTPSSASSASSAPAAGWENGDVDVDRTDLSLALTQTRNNLTYGIGVRRMAYEADDANAEWNYTGPELLLGAQMPFADSGWSASLTGSLGLYWWDFEREDFSDDGSTSGFTVDGGFAYLVEAVTLRAGYRIQNVSEDGDFAGDEFKGPYLDLGWMW